MKINKFKSAAALAMAIASIGGVAKDAQAAQAPKTITAEQNQNKVDAIKNHLNESKKVGVIGGMPIYSGYGIPPKIYGQYYVRRGSHKRTNK